MKNNLFRLGLVAILISVTLPEANAQGFLGRLKDKVKEKVQQKIENKIDKAVDGVINDTDDAISKKSKGKEEAEGANDKITNAKDFKRGAVVLFQDAFETDPVGEFPAHWELKSGLCEVVNIGSKKAMKVSERAEVMPLVKPNAKNYLTDEFTLEYKYYISNDMNINTIWFMPESEENTDNTLFHDYFRNWSYDHRGKVKVEKTFDEMKKGWHQVQISYNQGAYKFYIDGTRVGNLPKEAQANYFIIGTSDPGTSYYTDIILCKGAKEKHEQVATDVSAVERSMKETGKFVTNNILFDTGKATLKQESMIEIMKVAEYMKNNPKARFEVQGHTDNQGSDKINDPLSQERAEAIVKALASLGVDDFNLKAVGKGSHMPVADNKTEAGRAKNRRVEFIKR